MFGPLGPDWNPFLRVKKSEYRIGIFGGTFDPPTIGHAELVAHAAAQPELREIWVIPNGNPPGKQPVASWEKRLEWCRQSFGNLPKVRVMDLEPDTGSPNVTFTTLKGIKTQMHNVDLTLLMGMDQFENFPNWAYSDEISYLADLAIMPRDERVSSTIVREALAKDDFASIDGMIADAVWEDLTQNNIYRLDG